MEVCKVDQVHVDQPVQATAVQEPQHFAQNKRCSDRSNERRTDGLAGQQGDAATIKRTVV